MRTSPPGRVERLAIERRYRLPRIWSNAELAKIATLFDGSVINVSGWRDEDKEGNRYRDYFTRADSYTVSNYGGARGWSHEQDLEIDLEAPLPETMHGRFDVAFNHTTLEHVFDLFTAFDNLCLLSSDIVIVVVPFVQDVHVTDDFLDYWRFTDHALRQLFTRNGMTVLRLVSSPYPMAGIYHLAVASRRPEAWSGLIAASDTPNRGEALVRQPVLVRLRTWLANR